MTASVEVQILWRFPIEPSESGVPTKARTPVRSRAIGIAKDGRFHVVSFPATTPDGAEVEVVPEVSFLLSEGIALLESVLSGSQQAMTRPGAMRIVAATGKILAGVLFEPEAGAAMRAFAGEGAL